MEFALVVVGLLVLLWIRQYRYARRVTALRARQLSSETGIPSDLIEREILQRRITPGDWAREHELDPLTFRRPGGSPGGAFAERQLLEPDWAPTVHSRVPIPRAASHSTHRVVPTGGPIGVDCTNLVRVPQ